MKNSILLACLTFVTANAIAMDPVKNKNSNFTMSTDSLHHATIDLQYIQQLTVAGGLAPYTFKLTSGALPKSISLSAYGLLSGKPNIRDTGYYKVIIEAKDANGDTVSKEYALTTSV